MDCYALVEPAAGYRTAMPGHTCPSAVAHRTRSRQAAVRHLRAAVVAADKVQATRLRRQAAELILSHPE
jgi:hypothetical protein